MNSGSLRIIFKDDRDSRIGRGCILNLAHLRPEVIIMVRAAGAMAPVMDGNYMLVSEGWRSIRERRDLHKEGLAFDVSLNNVVGGEEYNRRKVIGEAWGQRTSERLNLSEFGVTYQIEVHGTGSNLHMHMEMDPQ